MLSARVTEFTTKAQTLHEQFSHPQGEVATLRAQTDHSSPEPASIVLLPKKFDGDHQEFYAFLKQCRLLFLLHPQQLTDQTKVGLVFSLLTIKALDWASPLLR